MTKFIKLKGNSNNNKDYDLAKLPVEKWQQEQYQYDIDSPVLKDWESRGGWFGYLIAPDEVVYDIDDRVLADMTFKAILSEGVQTQIVKTKKGYHFYFKNNGETQFAKESNNLGFLFDIRATGKGYVVYPNANSVHQFSFKCDELDVAPIWLRHGGFNKKRSSERVEKLGLPFTEGARDDSMTQYVGSIGHLPLSIDDKNKMVELVANYFCEPNLVGYEKFLNHEFLSSSSTKKVKKNRNPEGYTFIDEETGRFQHDVFANMLINEHHVKVIGGTPFYYVYEKGIYERSNFNRLMRSYYPSITIKEVKEVIFALEGLADEFEGTTTGYVPLANGLFNYKTKQVEEFTPDLVFTSRINVKYDPSAYDENVDNMLSTVTCGDTALRELVECMIADTINQDNKLLVKAFILKGQKGTGKSTFCEMVMEFLGNENYSSISLQDMDSKIEVCTLQGVQANIEPDMSSEYLKEPSNFKKITGGDIVTGTPKYAPPLKFNPYATIIIGLNGMPKYKDEGGAMKDRFVIVPFNNKFDRTKGTGSFIRESLFTDNAKSYLLNLAIGRLIEMYERKAKGERLLPYVEVVEREIEKNAIDQNPILQFTEETGLKDIVGHPIKDVYERYNQWCEQEGISRAYIKKRKTFVDEVCEYYELENVRMYNKFVLNTVPTFKKVNETISVVPEPKVLPRVTNKKATAENSDQDFDPQEFIL